MPSFAHSPKLLLRFTHYPPRILYALGLGPLIGRIVLLLTTTGRKSGLARVTPLQYEEVDGVFYIGSSRSMKSDWVRNIIANPRVEIHVGTRQFHGIAEVVSNVPRIADFLELRLRRHPNIVRAILRSQNLPIPPSRSHLEAYATKIALEVIHRESRPR